MTRIDPPPAEGMVPADVPRDFAMLAHDIRGALSGVIGGIALVDREGLPDAARLQFERISASAHTLAALVCDALGEPACEDEARITAKAEEADGDPAGVEFDAFLHFLARRWSGEAREKGLAFVLDRGDNLPVQLSVEHLDLSRVLGNVIGNAIKFADAGTIRLAVRRLSDGGLAFAVQDDGPGLGSADVMEVFSYGYRSAGAQKPGQGLGLHIAKTLTERMGGEIALRNRPQGGLEVRLVLPGRVCAGGEPDRDGLPVPYRGSIVDSRLPDLAGLRVLLAEDNPTNQMVASQMLRTLGAEVVVANDGVEAIATFEQTAVDLVIVDIEMPRKSGLEVIREIRARGDHRARTPIVALTAYAMQEHRDRISRAGANGLISKPILSLEGFGAAVAAQVREAAPAGAPKGDAEPSSAFDETIFEGLARTIGPEMMAELLDRVAIDLETAERRLANAVEPIDPAAIRASTHILISVAGAVGAVGLEARARILNRDAHGRETARLGEGVQACRDEISTALGFIRLKRARC